ncbi:DUF4232 domain-containing protein [Streptomyces lydicus]|uniref:DUF4232 domain-containing protein n=1 Tax=Streptomyces lydicus TaxID=47763 RepID=UPI00379D6678
MPSVTATARRAVAAGLSAAAVLALTTGCHGHTGNRPEEPATAVSPATPSAVLPDTGPPPPGPGGHTPCTPEMLRFHAGAPHRPDRRMLLTVTNYSDRTCDFAAQGYPLLRFGDGRQPALPVIADSKPRTTVVLAPDATAYATVLTSAAGGPHGRGPHGGKFSQFGVALAAGTAPTQVGLADRTPVRVDPHTAEVTYWQPTLDAARKW